MSLTFYPSLATLISLENIPSELGLLKGGLTDFFGHFFYRDLQIDKTVNGDAAFYSLKLLTYKRLALEVPGTGGLALILNPSFDEKLQGASSEFPISVSYKWGVLRYAKAFDLQTFDWSPASFFELILDITGATKQELLTEALSVLTDAPDPIQEFIDLFNNNPNNKLVAPLELRSFPTQEDAIADLLMQLISNDNDFDAYQVILDQYILSINSIDEIFDKLKLLFAKWLGAFSIDHIKELLIPQLSASVDVFSVGIQFPATILREVDAKGKPKPDPQNPSKDKPSLLSFDIASLKYSTASGLEFDLAESLNINFPRAEILKSGLILELHDVKVDFSRTKNIPEAIADGRPKDFVGVYVKDGTISFPAFWQHDKAKSTGIIKARKLLIGTGGFSGEFSLEKKTGITTKPLIECKFGDDFSVSLDKFSLTLKMNAIKNSTIEGTLVIPGFKDANKKPAEIRIKVAIRQDGDFDITAHEHDGFKTISCGEIFDLTLKSVFFGKKDDDFYLGVSGTVKFTHDLLAKVDPVEVEKLIIWSDGRFEIEGGTIPLPKNICFPIGPAKLSISAIHMGSHQQINPTTSKIRDFRYFGFDGGVDINPGGVDVQGKGIKFYYPVDLVLADCYLEIKSIAIHLVIPGTASKETASLLISGFLSIGGTETDPAWEGGVSFSLPKMKIAGGASMQLRPKVPAFIVDAFVELSTPLPFGASGLGIYGFDGLFGHHYLPSKTKVGLQDTDTWFDYYKKPPEGVHTSKFEGPSETKSYDNVFSIGAGVSLADTQNSGETFSCKLFFMLSLPDLIYLEGKANILGPRVGLTGEEDPPFFAVLALTPQSVEMGIGVSYKLPRDGDQKGWILDLNAEMRAAFFFQNSSAWYINFGTIQNPITAQVLSIFHGTAYVMLSAAGIAAGAGVTFGFNKSYAGGLVRASVGVYIKVGGFVSFERPQFGGFAMLGGHVDVSLMWFSFYISIDTSLSVEVARPFYIQGSVRLCVGVTIGFWKFKKTIHKCFDVEFKWVKNKAIDTTPVLPFADLTKSNALSPIMGINMLSGESFKVAYLGPFLPSANDSAFNDALLPLDTWVAIKFLKGLVPAPAVDARIGRLSGQVPANAIDYIPPAEVAHKVKHEYSIKAAEIKAWNGSDWVDYRTYEAMSPPDALNVINANPSVFKDGFWQNSGSGFNELRLLAETSLSYMQGQPGWYIPEQFGITSATLFCQTKLREKHCLDWTKVALGTIYAADAWRQTDTVLFRVSGGPGTVIDWNSHFGKPRSLAFANETSAQIVFNKPCVEVSLKLTTFSSGAAIRFFKRETMSAAIVYTLVETRTLSQLQLLAEIKYNDAANPVAKVEIDPINGDAAAIYALQVQIDGLYRLLNEENRDAKAKDALLAEIHTLEQELERLKGLGCSPNGINEDALVKQISIVKGQVEECRRQVGELQPAQRRACKEAADFRGRFERCFPHTPSQLSFEVVKRLDLGGRVHFQFIVYDDERDAILFNSAQSYDDEVSAERAVFETLKLAVRPGDYALMAPTNGQHFFQLVDTSGRFVAVNPGIFTKWDQLLVSWNETHTRSRTAQAGATFALTRRRDGKLPCDESLDHLTCWKELPALVAAGAGKCNAIVAGIQSAREAFCNAYNKLYRELYICNKQVLDQLIEPCDRLTHELDIKQKECQTLNDQLTALVELQAFIDQSGALIPPRSAPCSTLLHEACYLSLEDYQFNLSAPGKEAIDQDYQNATDAIRKWLTPIWRPDTKYCVRLHVTDTVNDVPSTDNDREFYFGFRTAGPVGHFHSDPSNYVDKAHGKKPDQYMLTGLKGYIDYARSYPDPSGQLIGAKPMFYEDARILLFFTKRYVYHFFGDWPAYKGLPALTGNAMQIVIKDPAEDTSIPNPPPPDITTTKIPQAVVTWPADDDPRIPEDIRALLNLHNPELLNPDFQGGDCWVSGGKMITPASVYTSVVPHYLKPLKLYTAIVNNVYQGQIKEVHQFVFQTSRYADFTAQVKSYRLDDGKGNQRDAFFRIETPLSVADLNLMFEVVTGNMSPANLALAASWADPFDRLVAGVMKLTPLDAAISTEFNFVANSTTGVPVAILIRNPEPFNNPKLPDDVLARSLRVLDGSQVDSSYQVLFSKDGSQAFVMHTSRVIPVTEMQFRFSYIEWDGSKYVERVVVISDFISTPTVVGGSVSTL